MELVMTLLRGLLGIGFLILICYMLSTVRSAINWRTVIVGISLQFILAVAILKVPGVSQVFDVAAKFFQQVLEFSSAGAEFLFSGLVSDTATFGYIFAFQVLPTIVFFSALAAVLFYLKATEDFEDN